MMFTILDTFSVRNTRMVRGILVRLYLDVNVNFSCCSTGETLRLSSEQTYPYQRPSFRGWCKHRDILIMNINIDRICLLDWEMSHESCTEAKLNTKSPTYKGKVGRSYRAVTEFLAPGRQ
jgi:hypothetical protein